MTPCLDEYRALLTHHRGRPRPSTGLGYRDGTHVPYAPCMPSICRPYALHVPTVPPQYGLRTALTHNLAGTGPQDGLRSKKKGSVQQSAHFLDTQRECDGLILSLMWGLMAAVGVPNGHLRGKRR